MKVILKQDVKALGKSGATVEVNEGYARNFLFPQKLAVALTEGAAKQQQELQKANEAREAKKLQAAKEVAETLGAKPILVKSKAGEAGKLYGTVTSKEVATAVKDQLHIELDRRKIEMEDAIKTLGTYHVSIKLHPQVVATINVKVEAEV